MAANFLNYVFLVAQWISAIIGSALLWRVFDAASPTYISGDMQRAAQYECCSFVFLAVINSFVVHHFNKDKPYGALRNISIAVLLYITCSSLFISFTVLNNLRIVDENTDSLFYIPYSNTNAGPLDHGDRQKYLGGLIIAWFSLAFGLLAITHSQFRSFSLAITHWSVTVCWIFGLILLIIGDIVSWTSSSISTYSPNDDPNWAVDSRLQYLLFFMTTSIFVQWVVLTLGIFTKSPDLLSASAFIFGITSLYYPIVYFQFEAQTPNNSNYLWAGPILDWIAGVILAIAAVQADMYPTGREVATGEAGQAAVPKKGEATV